MLHWNVSATAKRDAAGNVKINVIARDAGDEPLSGLQVSVRLQRPVDKRLDHDATLVEQVPGAYGGRLADVAEGQWDLVIEAESTGSVVFRSRSRLVLN